MVGLILLEKKLKGVNAYQKVCGITAAEIGAGGDMALDSDEESVYFRIGEAF